MRLLLSIVVLGLLASVMQLDACCPVGRSGKPVVNADQTVIIVWDAEKKQQHFIRKATFASKDQDFGFIIPSPSEPNLGESNDEAFSYLLKLTSPAVIKKSRTSNISCGCSEDTKTVGAIKSQVTVLQEKQVAGFQAVVLEARNSTALTKWLGEHGYAYSADIAAWAQPYIDQGWKFTALKVAAKSAEPSSKLIEATALRMSFSTDKPLFPYREPASTAFAKELQQQSRLLRIYFVADKMYEGKITHDKPWSGQVAWARGLTKSERDMLIKHLQLPAVAPSDLFLTEFEDRWPYAQAAGDVYFNKNSKQDNLQRQPIIEYAAEFPTGDASNMALAGIGLVSYLAYRGARGRRGCEA